MTSDANPRRPLRNTTQQWGSVSIALHWLTVAMVVVLCAVGFVMQELPSGEFKRAVFALHRSFGVTLLALVLLRLLWRLVAGAPRPEPMPRWQAVAATTSHGLLYVVLLAMPLTGWLQTSAAGFPLRWFGQFTLPALAGRDRDVARFANEAHELLFLVLAALVTVHALAALRHHYLDRDRTLQRMLPIAGPPPPRGDSPPG